MSGLRRAVRGLGVPPSGARRHLAPGLSLDDFFAELEQRDVCYVVLRWFDTLPDVDAGEDIDLLVADEDLTFVRSLMTTRSGSQSTQKFDIYSVSGLPGSDFHGVPYYAPRFAREMLDGGTWLRDRYRVPSLQHHYDSLAYHAVYHKGHASGLSAGPGSDEIRRPTDHDYEAVLAELAERLDRPLHPTLDSLDRYLAARDLRPPLDTLERLEPANPWIHKHFFDDQPAVDDLWGGLAVFVLRDRAKPQVDVAVEALDREGFEVLDVVELNTAQRARASHRLRGGNWAQGPWPLSGGAPATFVIAYDVAPEVSGLDPERGTNLRIPRAKDALRAHLLDGVGAEVRYNPVHSSDNPRQALDYLEVLGGSYVEHRLRPLVQRLVDSVTFPYPVVRKLPGGARRAQVAVVEHPVHGQCVCKLFRPGAARFLDRELRARAELGDLPEVPDLLERGDNWVLTTLYTDDRSHNRRLLPGRQDAQLTGDASRALARFAHRLHDRGLFLLDLSTHNVVTDPAAGLKVLDLEFLQEYREPAPAVPDSYTFRGVPAGTSGYDVPKLTGLTQRVGGSAFHPAVSGASVESLLQPHRPLNTGRRVLVQSGWYVLFLGKRLRRAARSALGASRVGRDVRMIARGLSRRRGRS
ncbi:hypothetical protein [Modestobacter sp. DSM 44400]|uniref:hypothetical protein n=1 Tax=Modestobacter sp. DSM 44400 TaxID=1550230 RepID=UPI000B83D324|nr:hypothetical protein [Modestobacter sp. DSM 44400]